MLNVVFFSISPSLQLLIVFWFSVHMYWWIGIPVFLIVRYLLYLTILTFLLPPYFPLCAKLKNNQQKKRKPLFLRIYWLLQFLCGCFHCIQDNVFLVLTRITINTKKPFLLSKKQTLQSACPADTVKMCDTVFRCETGRRTRNKKMLCRHLITLDS